MFLIVGLGNPGKEYVNTRHNAGFMTIDRIADKYGIDVVTKKLKGFIGKGTMEGHKVILVKPQTFMNASGDCVAPLVDYYKPEKVIVVYDDITLDVGGLRVRKSGSAGGHNGMKSIIARLGTEDFERVRVGIGEKPPKMDLADWVLGHFHKEDMDPLNSAIDDAVTAITMLMNYQIDDAMNRFNRKVDRK